MNPYIGEIRLFAGTFAPLGWLLCDGSTVSIDEYSALFALIGTTYGGNGQTDFALPDLRSRTPIHRSGTITLGTKGGAETVALVASQLPNHTHPAVGADVGTTGNPRGAYWAGTDQLGLYAPGNQADESMNGQAIGATGRGLPHSNLMPYLAVNFIIAIQGVFPAHN